MPDYKYMTKNRFIYTRHYPRGEAPETITLPDGDKAYRDMTVELRKCNAWPRSPESLGTHPNDIDRAMQESKDLGVPTKFRKDGLPVFTSKQHQDAYMKAKGHEYRR